MFFGLFECDQRLRKGEILRVKTVFLTRFLPLFLNRCIAVNEVYKASINGTNKTGVFALTHHVIKRVKPINDLSLAPHRVGYTIIMDGIRDNCATR